MEIKNVLIEGVLNSEIEIGQSKNGNRCKKFWVKTGKENIHCTIWERSKMGRNSYFDIEILKNTELKIGGFRQSDEKLEIVVTVLNVMTPNRKYGMSVEELNKRAYPGQMWLRGYGWARIEDVIENKHWLEWITDKLGASEVERRFRDWTRENWQCRGSTRAGETTRNLLGFNTESFKEFRSSLIAEAINKNR